LRIEIFIAQNQLSAPLRSALRRNPKRPRMTEMEKSSRGRRDTATIKTGSFFQRGIPPPPRSIGIMDLATKSCLICGLQSLTGKILSGKELRAGIGRWLMVKGEMSIEKRDFSVKVE
jgi:hypothetical protein